MENKYDEFQNRLAQAFLKSYPNIKNSQSQPTKQVLSPHTIQLPKNLIERCSGFINQYNDLVYSQDFGKALDTSPVDELFHNPNKSALLTCFDFHYNEESKKLSLIEVNTNASGFLLVNELYKVLQIDPYFNTPLEKLKKSFFDQFPQMTKYYSLIIDEQINEQNMFFEFQLYSNLFSQWGCENSLANIRDLMFVDDKLIHNSKEVYAIYNRYCDFYLTDPKSSLLRNTLLKNKVLISPSPESYFYMADKNRMIQLNSYLTKNTNQLPGFRDILLETIDLGQPELDVESLWTNRKKYFFKHKQSFGGKSVYNGKSISKKVFNRLIESSAMAQETAQPGHITVQSLINDNEEINFKYDLRLYTYGKQIQLGAARLYQGQVTSMKHPEGGFSAINWV